jgi:hypothetical protein
MCEIDKKVVVQVQWIMDEILGGWEKGEILRVGVILTVLQQTQGVPRDTA